MLLTWIIVFSVLGSAGAIAGAVLLLVFQQGTRENLLPCLLSYATGTLLGAAFLGMIPKALQQNTALAISATILAGIVSFFILEKMVIWRHCHTARCEVHRAAGPLILIGDAFHNIVNYTCSQARLLYRNYICPKAPQLHINLIKRMCPPFPVWVR